MIWQTYIPREIQELYEVHESKHGAAILANEFPNEFQEICDVLAKFRFTKEDVLISGGNESNIPKHFSEILRPLGWMERELIAKVVVGNREYESVSHKVDYIKGRIALDLEWNSKDQTFDRDLYAFRAFFDYDEISVGILITRSNQLDPWFKQLGQFTDRYGIKRQIKNKFGASTTHMGKLLPRLQAGRNGGCPVLVFGITPKLISEG